MTKKQEHLKKFLEKELSDYSYWTLKEITLTEAMYKGSCYFEAKLVSQRDKVRYLQFRIARDNKVYLQTGEDSENETEINRYESSIKFFWMYLLWWHGEDEEQ